MKRSALWRFLALFLALGLIAAACSDDDDDDTGDDTGTTTEETSDTADTADTADTEEMEDTADTADTDAAADTSEDVELVQDGSTLDAVIEADVIKCGTRDALPGFSVLTEDGDHVGFDADFCRVIAAGVLGDATKVDFVDLETADRFTALQSGQIDVLVRAATWTASRDGGEGTTFLHPNFYDGQGIMVAADSGFASIEDLNPAVVCVAQGTTTEGNAADEAQRLGLELEVRGFENPELIQEAFIAGQCDAWSADGSQLAGLRSEFPDGPDALVILDTVFSKEPLAPAVRDGDTEWAQAVDWSVMAPIQAEEFGIDSTNVDSFSDTTDPNIQKFLGLEFEGDDGLATLDPGLGLAEDFAAQIVTQVGNYAEIFDANVAPLGLERGLNALYTDGGIQYVPPYK
jgi:general L-amino acid transport system substrate-binding protein